MHTAHTLSASPPARAALRSVISSDGCLLRIPARTGRTLRDLRCLEGNGTQTRRRPRRRVATGAVGVEVV